MRVVPINAMKVKVKIRGEIKKILIYFTEMERIAHSLVIK